MNITPGHQPSAGRAVLDPAHLAGLSPAIEALGMAICAAEAPSGRLVQITPPLRELASTPEAPVTAFDLYHPDEHPGLAEALARAAAGGGEPVTRRIRTRGSLPRWWIERSGPARTPDGRSFWLAVLSPAPDQPGAGGAPPAAPDDHEIITRARLESLGRIAPRVGHDCNNLLMVVLGHADLIMASLSTAVPAGLGSVRDDAEQASKAARAAGNLMRHLVDFARPALDRVAPFRLDVLLRELAGLLQVAVRKPFAVRVVEPLPIVAVDGNAAEIRQLVTNVVLHAADAITHERGEITLALGLHDVLPFEAEWWGPFDAADLSRFAVLEISDNGSGSPEAAWEPSLRPERGRREVDQIASVPRIALRHRARLRIEGRPGAGSTVSVAFPIRGG